MLELNAEEQIKIININKDNKIQIVQLENKWIDIKYKKKVYTIFFKKPHVYIHGIAIYKKNLTEIIEFIDISLEYTVNQFKEKYK
jgi:hypothetical protein